MTTTQTATSARTAAEGLILEENHDLPLCRLQLTLRVGATSDQTAAGTAAEDNMLAGTATIIVAEELQSAPNTCCNASK